MAASSLATECRTDPASAAGFGGGTGGTNLPIFTAIEEISGAERLVTIVRVSSHSVTVSVRAVVIENETVALEDSATSNRRPISFCRNLLNPFLLASSMLLIFSSNDVSPSLVF